MFPSVLAKQLQAGLCDYIETTFPMTNHAFQGTLSKFLSTENQVFRKPYVAVPLPFRVAGGDTVAFEAIRPKFKFHLHQQKALERLMGENGRSTLIATGTGSGKTECFLYPILEYCYRHRGEQGIKALIVYPMNALAADQSRRIAELIHETPELRGNVTAGMYVGGHEAMASTTMAGDHIITDHETMIANPPDILLTNYKMLDYLLVRPKDAVLWQTNRPETLKYIAVDELHTFDGAQGTDLACLLRRLKVRLSTPKGHICCVGTSATMGTKDSTQYMREYAGSVFGEDFGEGSVITEDRLTAAEFFAGHEKEDYSFPTEGQCQKLLSLIDEGEPQDYLACAAESWFDATFAEKEIMSEKTRLEFGNQLMKHSFTQHMIEAMSGAYVQIEYLVDGLRDRFPEISGLSDPRVALDALLALISHARIEEEGRLRPFLDVQVQFWFRELRRLLARVSDDKIEYALEADLNENQAKQYLPIVNCRDCGETGWAGIPNERSNMTMVNLDTFYNLYFNTDSKIKMIYPYEGTGAPHGMIAARLCLHCLQLDIGEGANSCSSCGKRSMSVVFPLKNIIGKEEYKRFVCPFCGSRHGLSLMGLRSATAISAEASQIYASRFNDDKKLLAFSDNVQDAAHRAGFFNFRTWRFALRGAIQRFALDEGKGLSLDAFQTGFLKYWHSRLTDEEFVGLFIAPNMTWMRAYEKMKLEGALGYSNEAKRLVDGIGNRIKHEIMLEYGLNSRIGRTLEKSSCSVLSFNIAAINLVADRVRERTVNELGALNASEQKVFQRMVSGFLHIMRANGAFDDPVYNTFTNNQGKDYMLIRDRRWMPGVKAGRNVPRFIYKPGEGTRKIWGFDALTPYSRYVRWIDVCIDEFLVGENVPDHIAIIVLAELVKSGIVVTMPSPTGYVVYAINREAVAVSSNVSQFICDRCGAGMSTSKENSILWDGSPCIRNNCSGRLYEDDTGGLDYYGKLYSKGHLIRVVAGEHTGLLGRDQREKLERMFKKGSEKQRPWETNLISCTPTLEMGIDIGALSTIALCNMPPAQAQYLQRTGRAGRKDGNSLTIAVANARPHDLYFYAEPLEMIQGMVTPPKVFLQASAVLERQFVAYSMDCWIKQGISEKAIPDRVGVCLNNLPKRSPDVFPFNFLLFVQNNLTNLNKSFIQMFASANSLDQDTIGEIERFAMGSQSGDSPMHLKILEAFESLRSQKNALQVVIKQLKVLVKEIESRPRDSSYEEELREIKSELYAFINVVRDLNKKNTFNFMSDEGLLPNYAFPEAGIVLKAVLFRKEESADDMDDKKKKRYEKMVFEYSRGASTALSEFAPANNFYVDGKKLRINQVDKTTAESTKWRLCPNCSHAEVNEHVTNVSACPRCGDPAWADAGQVRTMLKVRMVYSNMPYEKAQIGDESDDRNTVFYCKQLLVDIDEDNDIYKAYRMDNEEFPFGYEFVKKAVLREINFGERDIQGDRLTVSGVDEIRKGFVICRYCGRIQPKKGKPDHAYACRAKNPQPGDNDPFEECLFLYREFTTEALRVLVPATTLDLSKTRQESFIAAFMLGLKEYFGNVDHLRAALSDFPVAEAECRKQYLVMLDSVPGGTGYLKQLMQHDDALIEIFGKALAVLENCSCKDDPQKDGCYRCLYAYRQSQNIGEISRKTAILLLRQILSGKDNIEQIDKLRNVPVNSLFESELEGQFIQALKLMDNERRKVHVEKALVNLKEGYLLNVENCTWEIEPQVLLDERYGIPVRSRADFVLWPGKKSGGQRPVAVFTDGFAYHKDKCADDTLKREAIRRSNRFRVWTFSWKDIQTVFKSQGDYATSTLIPENMPSGSKVYRPTVVNGKAEELEPYKTTPVELLMRYLGAPDAEQIFKVHASAVSLSLLDALKATNRLSFDSWNEKIMEILDEIQMMHMDFSFGECLFGTWSPRNSNVHIKIYSGIGIQEMKEKKSAALPVVCTLLLDEKEDRTEKYEADWNGFWQFYNLMQFSDRFVGVTSIGLQQLIYSRLPVVDSTRHAVVGFAPPDTGEWARLKEELFDDEALGLATKLQSMDAIIPSSIGYELTGADGAVIAECEMAWEMVRVAALLTEQIDYKAVFEEAGWFVFTLKDDVPQSIKGG